MVVVEVDAHKRTDTLVAIDDAEHKLAEKTVAATPEGHLEAEGNQPGQASFAGPPLSRSMSAHEKARTNSSPAPVADESRALPRSARVHRELVQHTSSAVDSRLRQV